MPGRLGRGGNEPSRSLQFHNYRGGKRLLQLSHLRHKDTMLNGHRPTVSRRDIKTQTTDTQGDGQPYAGAFSMIVKLQSSFVSSSNSLELLSYFELMPGAW